MMYTRRNFFVGAIVGAAIILVVFGFVAFVAAESWIFAVGTAIAAILHGGGAWMIITSDRNFVTDKSLQAMGRFRSAFEVTMGLFGVIGAETLDPRNWS